MKDLDPTQYPVISIDGKDYELKFRCSDVIELKKKHGLDLFALPPVTGVDVIERSMKLLSAAIAHQTDLSYEALSSLIDLGRVKEVDVLIGASIKKAYAQWQPFLESEPLPVKTEIQ